MTNIRKEYHKNGKKMDYSGIDERFTPFYENGERVEVIWKKGYEDYTGYGYKTEGKKARFYVGKSTGWKPIYLQILKRHSIGGGSICSIAVESIRGLRIYSQKHHNKK